MAHHFIMPGWRRVAILTAAGIVGAALVGVGVFLSWQGLQKANAWAGVGSFFLGLITLAVTVWLGLRSPAGGGGAPLRKRAGRDINKVRWVRGSVTTGPGRAVPAAGGGRAADWDAGRYINEFDTVEGDFTTGAHG